ncbi:endonuclease/exonuclease/phosphatase family protein [Nocardiopsis sp. NPDC007018]|uniref:endonuclease/exonuclease/phosphatase family protein n=1 Tax=Nocardiopsis sp. NPDC007018 TaxID=3155721 RepID=UPI0033D98C18
MRVRFLIPTVITALLLALGAVPASAAPQGTLALAEGEDFTFSYSTPEPHAANWVGLYRSSGGGPVDEEYVAPSLVWQYAPESEGTVRLSADSLEPGSYTAFFLARDGYAWLAEPVEVRRSAQGPTTFPVEAATLHNARQGEAYEATLGGLVSGGGGGTEFTKVSGDAWVKVSPDGTLTGTPRASAHREPPAGVTRPDRSSASVTVEATGVDGSSARLDVTIPVRRHTDPLVDELGVMSLNTWHGGTQVNGYHEKQLRFLLESGADVVGLQETQGRHAARLAQALGWYHWQGSGSLGVISRYPIVEEYGEVNASGGVRIALDGEESQVNLWNVHLGYTPYGPYDFCFDGMNVERVLEREAASGRTPQITDTLAAMSHQVDAADDVPVLLVGDFNAPSHLDWTEELREKNCGYADVPWPTSVLPTQAGFTDSYRVANPDPVSAPGITWSPLYPFNEGSTGRVEPQDRIDFVYHAGDLTVRESRDVVVCDPAPVPGHRDNEWTTDHAAVLTFYSLPS